RPASEEVSNNKSPSQSCARYEIRAAHPAGRRALHTDEKYDEPSRPYRAAESAKNFRAHYRQTSVLPRQTAGRTSPPARASPRSIPQYISASPAAPPPASRLVGSSIRT